MASESTDEIGRSRVIVLDTAALIAGSESLLALGGISDPSTESNVTPLAHNEKVTFFTTPDVVQEVRDSRARAKLNLLDGFLTIRTPSAEALAAVTKFARATGDYSVLSLADLRVMALCWMLEVERGGRSHLRDEPVNVSSGQIRVGSLVPFEEVERAEAEQRLQINSQQEENDGWTTVGNSKPLVKTLSSSRSSIQQRRPREFKQQKTPRNSECVVRSEHVSKVSNSTSTAISAKGGSLLDSDKLSPRNNFRESGRTATESTTHTDEKSVDGGESVFDMNPSCGVSNQATDETQLADCACPPEESNSSGKSDENDVQKGDNTVGKTWKKLQKGDMAGKSGKKFTRKVVDDEDDGVGWINPGNLDQHLTQDSLDTPQTEEDEERVGCVTTDFAMQNTMLQIGLKILTVDGRRAIRSIRHFALRCHACGSVTRDLEKKFCDSCGNFAMHRVAFRVDKDGVARAFLNPKKGPYLRGTKYPIPMPRGGRHNKDLVLRADQIDAVQQRRIEKRLERMNVDVLDPGTSYNAGASFRRHEQPVVIGYGRRNPNEVRRKSRKKR